MPEPSIARRRLQRQHLAQPHHADPAEVVARLGAVQSQEYPGGKWSLGLRLRRASDQALDQAFNEGAILRTHVLRPTWHFVAPADIRWLLELTGPRVNTRLVSADRGLELDRDVLTQSYGVMANALRDGRALTRAELSATLAQAGLVATGRRLAHLIMHAELEALICSGPRRGKQFTYMLLDERAPGARSLPGDEALAELARRYFGSHGPAALRDFAWWSGLTLAVAKAGVALAGSALIAETIGGQTYYDSGAPPADAEDHQVLLLPLFDEFFVGYAGYDRSRRGGRAAGPLGALDPPLVIGGDVAGSWRRTLTRNAVRIEIAPFAPLAAADRETVQAAADRYGAFLGLPATLTVREPI